MAQMKNKYTFTKPKYSMQEEYVCLHDTNISAIKKVKSGIKLVCSDCFIVGKEGKEFYASKGEVLFEGIGIDDCKIIILYGKATSKGELLAGIPVNLEELNQYLTRNAATIEIYEEFYGYTGAWLKGNIIKRNNKETFGIDWTHVIIRILENTSIHYSGYITLNQ